MNGKLNYTNSRYEFTYNLYFRELSTRKKKYSSVVPWWYLSLTPRWTRVTTNTRLSPYEDFHKSITLTAFQEAEPRVICDRLKYIIHFCLSVIHLALAHPLAVGWEDLVFNHISSQRSCHHTRVKLLRMSKCPCNLFVSLSSGPILQTWSRRGQQCTECVDRPVLWTWLRWS